MEPHIPVFWSFRAMSSVTSLGYSIVVKLKQYETGDAQVLLGIARFMRYVIGYYSIIFQSTLQEDCPRHETHKIFNSDAYHGCQVLDELSTLCFASWGQFRPRQCSRMVGV